MLGVRALVAVLHAPWWMTVPTMAASGLGGIVGALVLSRLLEGRGVKVVFPLAFIGMTVGAAVTAVTANPLLIALGIFLISLGGSPNNVVIRTYQIDAIPQRLYNSITGASAAVSNVGSALGGFASGFLVYALGVGGAAWVGAFGFSVAATIACVSFWVRRNQIPLLPPRWSDLKEHLEGQGRGVLLPRLPNGRDKETPYMWLEYWGPDHGDPVLVVPDMPAYRLRPPLRWLEENNIRWIIAHPPGVGHSTERPGQDLESAAADLLLAAKSLDLLEEAPRKNRKKREQKKFAILGVGTGGPIALKFAELVNNAAPGRISCVDVIGGPRENIRRGDVFGSLGMMYMGLYELARGVTDFAESIKRDPVAVLRTTYNFKGSEREHPPGQPFLDDPFCYTQYLKAMVAGASERVQAWQNRNRIVTSGNWGIDWSQMPPVRF